MEMEIKTSVKYEEPTDVFKYYLRYCMAMYLRNLAID